MTQKVLDKGHVEYVEHMGSDIMVCNAARVSFAKETGWEVDSEAIQRMKDSGSPTIPLQELKKLGDKDKKLIKYLAKHNHWTPFAHPQITLRIKAPISVRTQFFKHKQGFVENEISRRYVSYTPEFYYPQWRGKPTNGAKQGSEDFIQLSVMDEKKYLDAVQSCVDSYDRLLEAGVAPEQARFILPQGMYTEWYWTGSLAAYARFYKQRIDEHAQWEIRQYAEAVGKIISPLFPESWKELTQCH
jgi:thymidylate synthase (FAD)